MVKIEDTRKSKGVPIAKLNEGEFIIYKNQLYIVTNDDEEFEIVNISNGEKTNLDPSDVVEVVDVTVRIEERGE